MKPGAFCYKESDFAAFQKPQVYTFLSFSYNNVY